MKQSSGPLEEGFLMLFPCSDNDDDDYKADVSSGSSNLVDSSPTIEALITPKPSIWNFYGYFSSTSNNPKHSQGINCKQSQPRKVSIERLQYPETFVPINPVINHRNIHNNVDLNEVLNSEKMIKSFSEISEDETKFVNLSPILSPQAALLPIAPGLPVLVAGRARVLQL